jgi:hypothetical protein
VFQGGKWCNFCKIYVDVDNPKPMTKQLTPGIRIWAVGNPWVIGHGRKEVLENWDEVISQAADLICTRENVDDIEFEWIGNTLYAYDGEYTKNVNAKTAEAFESFINIYGSGGELENMPSDFLEKYPPSYKYACRVAPLSEEEKKVTRSKRESDNDDDVQYYHF